MSVKQVPCRDVRTIKNGSTTIVTTETMVMYSDEFHYALHDLDRLVYEPMLNYYLTKGVAKLHPEDTYDEITGRIVASKKAEIKGNRISQRHLNDVKEVLESLLNEVNGKIARLEAREKSLVSSLEE